MEVLVHGGAGQTPADPERVDSALTAAATVGRERASPRAAVVAAVRHLEQVPLFNAGVGAAVQSDGVIRTDAGVMTSERACGAACAMPGVRHAVAVADAVATETPHVLVAGDRAVALADAVGVSTDADLWTPATRERWEAADPPPLDPLDAHLAWVRERFGGTDTVGAVASDGTTLAAATSTGGRWFALAGRVGDVPQVGAGFHATGAAAASATGDGEAIATEGLARRVVETVADGESPQRATDSVVRSFDATTDASAGLIVIDADGRVGQATNATAMPTATAGRS